MYDLIGDIHGHAEELKQLLTKMGYRQNAGCWRHPSRKVIFVGDFIDRGRSIREVLHLVKAMVDQGEALAVMGNHEYNAIAFNKKKSDGSFLRPHNPKNINQHQQTIEQFADYADEWKQWIEWFYTLPLFLDLKPLRVVHACWEQQHIDRLGDSTGGLLTESLLMEAHQKGSAAYTMVEDTLKGKEAEIPKQYAWRDKDGHPRTSNRIKWWIDPAGSDYDSFLFSCPEELKKYPVPGHIVHTKYRPDEKPVFFGHYWLTDNKPVVQTPNVVCLDYSVAKQGGLACYRFDEQAELNDSNFEFVLAEDHGG